MRQCLFYGFAPTRTGIRFAAWRRRIGKIVGVIPYPDNSVMGGLKVIDNLDPDEDYAARQLLSPLDDILS